MNHSFKKFLALVLTAATVFSLSAVAASSVFGADTAAGTGKTPIAAFDFKKDLKDHSGRTDVGAVVLDGNAASNATYEEGKGITLKGGFFALPEKIFTDTKDEIDGFTFSFTLDHPDKWDWNEILFSMSDKDVIGESETRDASFFVNFNGCVGTAKYRYKTEGCWLDTENLRPTKKHTITVTYDVADNNAIVYVDGILHSYSKDATHNIKAELKAEQIKSFASVVIGRSNNGCGGANVTGTYSDVVIYSTALNHREVYVLANEGWEAVKNYKEPEYALVKDAPVLTGKGDGTFTAAAFNVDGLPNKINMDLGAYGKKDISLNPDGPGADKTETLGKLIAEKGWDIIGVSENFTYGERLSAGLKGYEEEINKNKDTVPTEVSARELLSHFDQSKGFPYPFISLDTDGLSMFYNKDTVSVEQKQKVAWEENYSPYKGYGLEFPDSPEYNEYFYNIPELNGADKLITKGFRHYVAEVAGGLKVDVYTLHMDAENDPGDKNARAEQLKQLAKYIVGTKTENPIIILGDTNCRYTRDDVIGNLIGTLNAEDNLYAVDAWVETQKDGSYPEFASKTLDDEIVDKIIYVNNSKCAYQLCLTKYEEVKFTAEDGKKLSDHKAVVGTFAYAKKYDVTYNDGLDGKTFPTQTYHTLSTNETPKFNGTPTREGYVFKGWDTPVADTVTGTVTYSAKWEAAPASDGPGTTPGGQVDPSTTGDPANVAALLAVLAISGIGVTAVIRSKKKDR